MCATLIGEDLLLLRIVSSRATVMKEKGPPKGGYTRLYTAQCVYLQSVQFGSQHTMVHFNFDMNCDPKSLGEPSF